MRCYLHFIYSFIFISIPLTKIFFSCSHKACKNTCGSEMVANVLKKSELLGAASDAQNICAVASCVHNCAVGRFSEVPEAYRALAINVS